MADITRRFFLRHLRGEPTTFVRHTVRGKVRHEGVGQSFWYRPLTEALTAGITPVRSAVAAALADDPRLVETGVTVVSSRVVAIRPEPDLERALQTPTREAVQQEADRATYARRAVAVEQERAIAENELQNRIELARREQQLVEQKGANDRRVAELDSAAKLVASQGSLERSRLAAETERAKDSARADGVRAVGLASAETDAARLGAYREMPAEVLYAIALEKLAANPPQIGELTITPDVLTKLIGRFSS